MLKDLGKTQRNGLRIGIRDFSVKETDTFGRTTLIERDFSKQVKCTTKFQGHRSEDIFEYLADERATLGVWVPGDGSGFEHTLVYGYPADFEIDEGKEGGVAATCKMEIEGVI